MLGLRGVRLGLVVPGLFAHAGARHRRGGRRAAEGRRATRSVEIMVPLVGAVQELELVREEAERILAEVCERDRASTSTHLIGTMIELPRAALTAGQIAEAAEFFSFGTNDLTQTTWGFSRDDVEAAFFSALPREGHLRGLAVRVARPRRASARWCGSRAEEGRATTPGPQARRVRRARRRPRLGALLPRGRARLRVLLAVPRAGRPAGGRSGRARGGRQRQPVSV